MSTRVQRGFAAPHRNRRRPTRGCWGDHGAGRSACRNARACGGSGSAGYRRLRHRPRRSVATTSMAPIREGSTVTEATAETPGVRALSTGGSGRLERKQTWPDATNGPRAAHLTVLKTCCCPTASTWPPAWSDMDAAPRAGGEGPRMCIEHPVHRTDVARYSQPCFARP